MAPSPSTPILLCLLRAGSAQRYEGLWAAGVSTVAVHSLAEAQAQLARPHVVAIVVDGQHAEARAVWQHAERQHPEVLRMGVGPSLAQAGGDSEPMLPVARMRHFLHDVSNPVASVQANISWLAESLATPPPAHEIPDLQAAARDALSATETIRSQIRSFRAQHTEVVAPKFEAGRAITVGVGLAAGVLGGRLTVNTDGASSALLPGDPNTLSQLVANLLLDAARTPTGPITMICHATPAEVTLEITSAGQAAAPPSPPAELLTLLRARLTASPPEAAAHIVRVTIPR